MAEWLQNMSDELKTVLDAMPSMVLIMDDDLRIHDANSAAGRTLGVDAGTISGSLPGTALNCVNEHNSTGGCGTTKFCPDCIIRRSVQQARQQQSVFRETNLMQTLADGEKRNVYYRVSASPFTYRRVGAYVVVLEDITELIVLRSIIPICAECKKIRNEQNSWENADSYLTRNTTLQFSHGLCPACLSTLYPDYQPDNSGSTTTCGKCDDSAVSHECTEKENIHV